jgi:hypothetical protein
MIRFRRQVRFVCSYFDIIGRHASTDRAAATTTNENEKPRNDGGADVDIKPQSSNNNNNELDNNNNNSSNDDDGDAYRTILTKVIQLRDDTICAFWCDIRLVC